ncbi:6747_t:CDS:2, partial [Dentiscutata erythropus]
NWYSIKIVRRYSGVQALANTLRKTSIILTHQFTYSNGIVLANALKKITTLTSLNIGFGNNIGPKGTEPLSNALITNNNLNLYLNLSKNYLDTEETLNPLIDVLKKSLNINCIEFFIKSKVGYARQTELGDATFFENKTEHELRIVEITSKEYADLVRLNVSDNETFDPNFYNPVYEPIDDHGTLHLSVVDADDMAVSVTSGSQVMNPDTEIHQMDDFSVPECQIYLSLICFNFFFKPGKIPLSSMVPTIMKKTEDLSWQLVQVYVEYGFPFDFIRHLLDIHHVLQIRNINGRESSSQIQEIRKWNYS